MQLGSFTLIFFIVLYTQYFVDLSGCRLARCVHVVIVCLYQTQQKSAMSTAIQTAYTGYQGLLQYCTCHHIF